MNTGCRSLRVSRTPLDRGKVLNAEDLERAGSFARYRDVDGDATLAHATGTMHQASTYTWNGAPTPASIREAGRVRCLDGAAGAQFENARKWFRRR